MASTVKIEKGDSSYRLISDGEEMIVRQYLETDDKGIIKGDKSKPVAVNSAGFAKVKETNQLVFKKSTTESNVFLTSIYDDRVVENLNIEITDEKLIINIENKIIDIYL